ncbi:MAG: hypothetical protein ABI411_15360 [Tahibacter sp.]
MTAAILAMLLLTLALGGGIWAVACGVPRRAPELTAALGPSFVLGSCAAGMLLGLAKATPGNGMWDLLWPSILGAIVVLWTFAWWWGTRKTARVSVVSEAQPLPGWAWMLLALLVVHGVLISDEAWLRPIFPWDAWLAWSAKAKAWYTGSQLQGFVGPDAWLADRTGRMRTSLAYHYPELLARIELWFTAPAAAWNEAAIGLSWPLLWLALLMGCYSQWRSLGVAPGLGVAGVYALGSLPLLNVHAALAGYADLWLAVVLVFAVLEWQLFLRTRARGRLLLSCLFLLFAGLFKFEGFAWGLLLVGTMVFGEVPARHRWKGLAAAILVALLLLGLSYALELPWIGMVRRLLNGEAGGREASSWWPVLRALVSGLLAQNNWHLLWLCLPALVLWRWRALLENRDLGLLALYLLGALSIVAALFLLTPAAKWAESNTAINRLVLQLVPIAVSLIVLLLRDVDFYLESSGTDPVSAEQPVAE